MARTARAAPSLTDNTPDYVDRSYDEELLEKYQPMLEARHDDAQLLGDIHPPRRNIDS